MKIAFIFAGQGSQYIGMGKELYDNILICREAFDKARSLLDFDIKELMFNGEKEKLDIHAVPTVYINGEEMSNKITAEELEEKLKSLLK